MKQQLQRPEVFDKAVQAPHIGQGPVVLKRRESRHRY